MFNLDKSISIVFNGEIYNYLELRMELLNLGHVFYTNSDTEVIIKAYEEWGVDCQNKFNGMWAFALWDNRNKTLFLSRDRIGEKPLHYAIIDNSLIFASEIKSLFEYGLQKEFLFEFMEIYMVLKSIPAPYSFLKNVKKLQPGHYILADIFGYQELKYWDLSMDDEKNMIKKKEYVFEEFESILNNSTKIRMHSDVPFGAFLSGGLDSASIVALMSEISPFPIKTFTIGYDEKEYDERKLAGLVAKKFRTDHYEEIIKEDGLTESLNKIIFHYDEPFGDSSAIPVGNVSKFAAQHVKMVLTGDGGDEVLSGYPSYQGIKIVKIFQKMPYFLQHLIPASINLLSQMSVGAIRYQLNRYQDFLNTSKNGYNIRLINKRSKPGYNKIKALINSDIKTWPIQDYISDFMSACNYRDDFYKEMFFNFKFDLPNDYLVKVDRMSMAYSLETRLPFLDYRLIEFMVRVDKDIKMQGLERKSILKKTIARKLPPLLMNAPKKGFRVPVREWFKSIEYQRKLSQIGLKNDFINYNEFQKIINENKQGYYDNGNLIWSLMILDKIINK